MSKAINSPTGRLLRSSRLFSLPPPLPAPQLEAITSAGVLRNSDTATLPYPTRQAITTPTSSRSRGDWGLKRALPQRSTQSSTPHLRIKAIDTLEHITDFESAADHTQNLAKWQEMNIPMVPARLRENMSATSNRDLPLTVFEDGLDNTAFADPTRRGINEMGPTAERAMLLRTNPSLSSVRWKTEGPWLEGMSEDEFQKFLTAQRKQGKTGFLEYVRQVRIDEKRKAAIQAMRNERGFDPENEDHIQEVEEKSTLGDGEFENYVKELRDNFTGTSSTISSLIESYFDMPQSAKATKGYGSAVIDELMSKESSSFGKARPPATHPSGGLFYIKTNAYMQNHPTWGPQAIHEPVEARVLRPSNTAQAASQQAAQGKSRLGVGGFVVDGPSGRSNFKGSKKDYDSMVYSLDPELHGGNKVWVHPERAYMDDAGRVRLEVSKGNDQAVEVKTGEINWARLNNSNERTLRDMRNQGIIPELDGSARPAGTVGNANYGTRLPDLRPQARRASRPGGFDDEIRQGSGSPADSLKRLLGEASRS